MLKNNNDGGSGSLAPYASGPGNQSQQPSKRFPVMSDGRQFTSYTPRCAMERPATGISSFDLKDMMIRDAEKIMDTHRKSAAANVNAEWCEDTAPIPGSELIVECSDRACAYTKPGLKEPLGISTDNTRLGI